MGEGLGCEGVDIPAEGLPLRKHALRLPCEQRTLQLFPSAQTFGSRHDRYILNMSSMSDHALQILAIVAVALAGVGLAMARPRLRGTTLTAPLAWGIASAAAVGGVELALLLDRPPGTGPLTASVLRYIAAAGTFCPLMAVLGAKRPQDRGWQWVVVSLWVILVLPGIHSLLIGGGSRMELEGPWRWFTWMLLTVTAVVYLPTQYWPAAILAIGGQGTLLSRALLPGSVARPAACSAAGAAMLSAAVAAAWWMTRQREPAKPPFDACAIDLPTLNRRWRSFRNGWGALWGLRVMLRVNQTAELQDWPVRLRLSGFQRIDDDEAEIAAHEAVAIDAALDAVLRRFERQEGRRKKKGTGIVFP